MATNLQKLAERLKQLEDGAKASEFAKYLWRPKEGRQEIRIIPRKSNPEVPFIELKFYYKLGGPGGTYLAPCTFGKPDPVLDCVNLMLESGSDEEKKAAFEMKPKDRYFVPVIVRGEEDKGVRFWGFGIQVYKQLMSLFTDPNWGDIASLAEGNDLAVTFKKIGSKKNVKTGEPFPDVTINPKPQKTPAVDPTNKDLMEKVKNQPDIFQVYPLRSYEELKVIVGKWLHPEQNTGFDPDAPALTPEQEALAAAQSVATAPPLSATAAAGTTSKGTKAAEFEKFFKTDVISVAEPVAAQ